MDVRYVVQDAVFTWDSDKAEANLHNTLFRLKKPAKSSLIPSTK